MEVAMTAPCTYWRITVHLVSVVTAGAIWGHFWFLGMQHCMQLWLPSTHTSTCCAGGCQLSACKLKGTCSVSVVPAVRNLAIHLLLITINLEWRWWAKTSKYPDKNSCNGAGCWVTVAREEVTHKNWLNMQPTVKQGNVASNGWFNNIFVIDF